MTRAAKDAPPAICRWGVVGCLGVAAADGEPRPRLRLRADRPDLGAAAGEGEMTVSLRACGHTHRLAGRPCRCAYLRRAARGDAEERAARYRRALEEIAKPCGCPETGYGEMHWASCSTLCGWAPARARKALEEER